MSGIDGVVVGDVGGWRCIKYGAPALTMLLQELRLVAQILTTTASLALTSRPRGREGPLPRHKHDMDTEAAIDKGYLRLTKGKRARSTCQNLQQRQPAIRLAPLQQQRRRRHPPTRPRSFLKNHKAERDGEESADSWDDEQQQRAGGPGGSWSEQEAEAAATQRSLEQWARVERTLFDEEDQLPVGCPLADECLQWRGQLPHLRIVGSCSLVGPESPTGPTTPARRRTNVVSAASSSFASPQAGDNLDPGILCSGESSLVSLNQQSRKKAKEEVLDYIVEFISKELAEIAAEKEAEDLSDNLDEFLKITPAPTEAGKNPIVSNRLYFNIESADSPTKPDIKANGDDEREDQIRRNKMGTIFNERIIVSPVPFIITTRESFSTLKQTPIQYLGDSFNREDVITGTKRDSTQRKSSLARKTPLVTTPQVHGSWNTQAYPEVWPKNIKLTPIDTSRLPSSKKRTSKTADSVPPRRSRNSLSPISHSTRALSPGHSARSRDNPLDGLEIRGSQIVAQVQRINGKPARTKLIRAKRVEGQ
ncbi:hypothetical protein QAD02_001946 [Eretmocerus hayati]|uniref:Uncharacterized protein n=1 Tax=Eretmocerus hayati TaxID=131215 RepID=A0ACC2NHW1_9HYME|nr:hypothetical protein QAD02_001946 [Eretmocerus hayati]